MLAGAAALGAGLLAYKHHEKKNEEVRIQSASRVYMLKFPPFSTSLRSGLVINGFTTPKLGRPSFAAVGPKDL